MEPFLLTAELGLTACVTRYPHQLHTAGEFPDDILELFKGSGLELHYFVHSLRPDVDVKTW